VVVNKRKKIRLGLALGFPVVLCVGAGALSYARPEWASSVGTVLIFLFGVPLTLAGGAGLWAGLGYRGSPGPSAGPGLGAALALLIGLVAGAIGVPLLVWGARRLLG
jgi:hypothetical protein